MSSNREELIKEINLAMFKDDDKGCVKPSEIADFVLNDRKRICEPIERVYQELGADPYTDSGPSMYAAIIKTLKLAGLSEEKV